MNNRKIATILATGLSVIACFALLPFARAVVPPPDGGYPGGNTAEGQNALFSRTTGSFNTAIGILALRNDTTESFNTGVGAGALLANASNENTAVGAGAMLSNQDGFDNTAVGAFALVSNVGGGPTIGNNNTAVGDRAMQNNTIGNFNTAVGSGALVSNVDGNINVAIGHALANNTSGTGNVALGGNAGSNATTGDHNVYIGQGVAGVAGESDHTYIRNINTTTVPAVGTGDFVTVDLTTGLMGHALSSGRYKEEVKPMDKASQALYRLKPVTFRYKKEVDRTRSLAFGLIAEQVAEVNPDLIARNSEGKPESVHYEMVNAMLLNEFLKEHQTVQELKTTVAEQKKQIDALSAGLQKVSAQLEVSKPAPQLAVGNQ